MSAAPLPLRRVFLSEAIGTALLLLFGLPFVILMFGTGSPMIRLLPGETLTFALVTVLCVFLGFRHLRWFTPATMPILYGIMVPLEAAISGTSTNPARSFGPSLLSGQWDGWWIYWAGPLVGTLAAIVVCSALAKRIEEAKLYHVESDRRRLLHATASRS